MSNNSITFDEIVEIFINFTIGQIQTESEIPRVDFKFDKKGLDVINEVKNRINNSDNYLKIKDENINKLNDRDDNCILIKVHDAYAFFSLLKDLVNASLSMGEFYHIDSIPRSRALSLLRRIWLRMDVNDIDNIESFLFNQLMFLKDKTLDSINPINIGKYLDYDVFYKTEFINNLYESNKKALFRLNNINASHDLSAVLYDIKSENDELVCYISAVQKQSNSIRNKKIERSLYQINSLSPDHKSEVHPNMSVSMVLFLDILRKNNINHIKVPLYQVLSYDFHVLLSKYAKRDFEKNWDNNMMSYLEFLKSIKYMSEYENLMKKYNQEKSWVERLDGKEDNISHQKTDNLANLFLFLERIGECKINSLPLDDTLYLDIDISLNKEIKR